MLLADPAAGGQPKPWVLREDLSFDVEYDVANTVGRSGPTTPQKARCPAPTPGRRARLVAPARGKTNPRAEPVTLVPGQWARVPARSGASPR